MTIKIVDITEKNFPNLPRPANKRFNCQECFYWMGKRDGRTDLVKQKKNWFIRRGQKYGGSLGKILLWGKRENPVGFIQYGPVAEFQTARLFYKTVELHPEKSTSPGKRYLLIPKGAWCITCVAIQAGFRHKGLATRLVRQTLRDLKRRGVKSVDAYPLRRVNSWNQVSVGPNGLWQKCGFKEVARIKYIKGEPVPRAGEKEVILMRKKW